MKLLNHWRQRRDQLAQQAREVLACPQQIQAAEHRQNGLEAELESCKRDLVACQAALSELRDELFHVPTLPDVRYLANPLEDRLQTAQDETAEYLRDASEISDEERRYLLMQMFFRGSTEQVRDQLSGILQNLEIAPAVRNKPVLDVGCGRGELLEILSANGYRAIGVDTSELVVKKLADRALQARHGDAIEQLSHFADESLCGVTAFHVIEHVEPAYFQSLLLTAYQKIAPGGFLLLETPNPFCFEALSFFYTDDTHCRPIQPFQLAFLVESAGFHRSRAHFSAPVPAGRKQAIHNWIRLYQNHGILAYKPQGLPDVKKNVA